MVWRGKMVKNKLGRTDLLHRHPSPRHRIGTAPHTRSVPLQGIALQGHAPSLFTPQIPSGVRAAHQTPHPPTAAPPIFCGGSAASSVPESLSITWCVG